MFYVQRGKERAGIISSSFLVEMVLGHPWSSLAKRLKPKKGGCGNN